MYFVIQQQSRQSLLSIVLRLKALLDVRYHIKVGRPNADIDDLRLTNHGRIEVPMRFSRRVSVV